MAAKAAIHASPARRYGRRDSDRMLSGDLRTRRLLKLAWMAASAAMTILRGAWQESVPEIRIVR
jgi:hypothetical protein